MNVFFDAQTVFFSLSSVEGYVVSYVYFRILCTSEGAQTVIFERQVSFTKCMLN